MGVLFATNIALQHAQQVVDYSVRRITVVADVRTEMESEPEHVVVPPKKRVPTQIVVVTKPVALVTKTSSSVSSSVAKPVSVRVSSSRAPKLRSAAPEQPVVVALEESSSSSATSSSVSSVSSISSSASSISASASSSSSVATVSSSAPATQDGIPVMTDTLWPFARAISYGSMLSPGHGPGGWDRTYSEMTEADFVALPRFNAAELEIPMTTLMNRSPSDIKILNAKYFYSTRYFSEYDLDAREFDGPHNGIDLKMPMGTPIGAIGAGRVVSSESNVRFGLNVLIEHRLPSGKTVYSFYAHMSASRVKAGDIVKVGQTIGSVGNSGPAGLEPHLHLAVVPNLGDQNWWPNGAPNPAEASKHAINPRLFIDSGGTQGF